MALHLRHHSTLPWALLALLVAPEALAQDAARGAQLYMRMPSEVRSCVSCHGADPGQNPNNILRAADNPRALTQVLNTVGVMGFLRSELAEADIADVSAFLGTVLRLNSGNSPLRMWPITHEFGAAPVGSVTTVQTVQLENRSATGLGLLSIAPTDPSLAVTHDCPDVLGVAARCSLRLAMTPLATGWQRAALRVQTAEGSFYTGASALGTPDALSVLRWRGDPSLLGFSPAAPDATARQTLVLENPGVMPVVLGNTTVVGPQASQFRREGGCQAGLVLQAGTSCTLVVAHTASHLPLAQATLQLRGDGGNPASVALEAVLPAPASVDPMPTALPEQAGGGCSVGPPGGAQRDISVLASLLLAMGWLLGGKRRRRR